MAIGRIRESSHNQNAEINMVPLIDVMLVLLVIFIITAPMVTQSVSLTLPKTSNIVETAEDKLVPQIIEITKEGDVLLNKSPVMLEELKSRLLSLKTEMATDDLLIQLNIDETIPYDMVAKTLIEIKNANIAKIGFMTTLKE